MFKADKKIYLKLAIISAHEEICTDWSEEQQFLQKLINKFYFVTL